MTMCCHIPFLDVIGFPTFILMCGMREEEWRREAIVIVKVYVLVKGREREMKMISETEL